MSTLQLTPLRLFEPWETIRESIHLIVEPLDEEAFTWRAPGTRHSPDWIVRHLATAEEFWVDGVITGRGFQPKRRREFPGKDAILAEWARVHQRSLEVLGGLTVEDLFRERRTAIEPSPFAGQSFTLYEVFTLLVSHDAHHRGQLQLMLRLMGREPDDGVLLGRRGSGGDGPRR